MHDALSEQIEKPNPVNTRFLEESDIQGIQPILERWIRDAQTGEPFSAEVEEVMRAMHESTKGLNNRTYIIAETLQDGVVGVIGFRPPEERMVPFKTEETAVEIINAYVAETHRAGKGIGTSMVSMLEKEARSRGIAQVVLNSGPRYKHTAWGFYDKLPGYQRVGEVKDMYGVGRHAPVWRKDL